MNDIIFNADDFGISRGVNEAIFQAYQKGVLNAASLMVNQKYAAEAVALSKKMPDLRLGLHVNLTNEKPAADPSKIKLLVGPDGKFKNGFVKLLWLSLIHPKALRTQVETEVEAQILKALAMGARLEHLDSHRHVHMIPVLFEVFEKIARKYQIKRLRVMNECALLTMRTNKDFSYLSDGGLVKYFLLRVLSFLNGVQSKTYFYTMLYTCKLSCERFQNVLIPEGYDAVEVMIHPNMTKIDAPHPEDIFDMNVLSPWRDKEYETLCAPQILKNFHFGQKYPLPIALYRKLEKIWFKLNQKIRFLLVGGFNTVFAFCVYAFLLRVLSLPYLLALGLQWLITVNVSIVTMRYYVFQSHGNFGTEYAKAWGVYIWMLCFNGFFLSFLVEICGLSDLWAQAVYLTVSTILTYLLHKYFSFYKKN